MEKQIKIRGLFPFFKVKILKEFKGTKIYQGFDDSGNNIMTFVENSIVEEINGIIATYEYSFIKKHRNGWNKKPMAKWSNIETLSGEKIAPMAFCNHGSIITKLNPQKGERFILRLQNNITGTWDESVKFEFPIKISGINNSKDYTYSYKLKELV